MILGGRNRMSKNFEGLQVKGLDEVKILVNEETSYAETSRSREKRFAELLELFWNEGEKAEANL